jgi:hypothetical protein
MPLRSGSGAVVASPNKTPPLHRVTDDSRFKTKTNRVPSLNANAHKIFAPDHDSAIINLRLNKNE